MLVDAATHPGPALWQAIMLLLVIPWGFILFKWCDTTTKAVVNTIGYILCGVILFVVIVFR